VHLFLGSSVGEDLNVEEVLRVVQDAGRRMVAAAGGTSLCKSLLALSGKWNGAGKLMLAALRKAQALLRAFSVEPPPKALMKKLSPKARTPALVADLLAKIVVVLLDLERPAPAAPALPRRRQQRCKLKQGLPVS